MLTAIIGGSGLTELKGLEPGHREVIRTPWGEPSGALCFGRLSGCDVVFLTRHGPGHTIPPHKVNYRANLYALKQSGTTHVIAVNAVGGISADLAPPDLVLPDQIIDYTYSRAQTFFDSGHKPVIHTDFTQPYCEASRRVIAAAARSHSIPLVEKATYAATQGPRFETAAEVNRLERDGATIVGMTGMPEAALARELELCYAMIAVVANAAAGRGEGEVSVDEIMHNLHEGTEKARELLEVAIPLLGE
jgi:5'-deoxy-5'-methylthioadenosine phosphorylase